jgi:hypothetical protein
MTKLLLLASKTVRVLSLALLLGAGATSAFAQVLPFPVPFFCGLNGPNGCGAPQNCIVLGCQPSIGVPAQCTCSAFGPVPPTGS